MLKLPPQSWITTWAKTDGFHLLMPNMPDKASVPIEAQALVAALLRLQNEPAFLQECVDWLHDNVINMQKEEKAKKVKKKRKK